MTFYFVPGGFLLPGLGCLNIFREEWCQKNDLAVSKCKYIGDAAGRPKDFSDTDRKFALNALFEFQTPETFFKLAEIKLPPLPLQPFDPTSMSQSGQKENLYELVSKCLSPDSKGGE